MRWLIDVLYLRLLFYLDLNLFDSRDDPFKDLDCLLVFKLQHTEISLVLHGVQIVRVQLEGAGQRLLTGLLSERIVAKGHCHV